MEKLILNDFEFSVDEAELLRAVNIDADDDPELARAFNVQSIPMIALVKDNTFVDLSVGYVPKQKLKNLIEANK